MPFRSSHSLSGSRRLSGGLRLSGGRRSACAVGALVLPGLLLLGLSSFAGASPASARPRLHASPVHAAVAAAAVTGSTQVGNMTTLGGPVQTTSTSYAIYWFPLGSVTSANYRSVTQGYLHDVGGSAYYGIAGQYGVQNNSTFGGAWVDSSPFPAGRGSAAAPLSDPDVQGAVSAALQANPSWGPPGVTKTFFVFLPFGVYVAEGGTTSFASGGFCAYHSYFMTVTGADVVYAAMPYAATSPNGCGRPGPWPNQGGDPLHPGDADMEVNLVSHEQIEAVTDPLLNAWGFPSGPIAGQEIGDVCLGINGPRNADGSNVTLQGHPYLVQTQWSNADAPVPNDTQSHGCVLSALATPVQSTTTSSAGQGTTSSSTTSSTSTTVPASTGTPGLTRLAGPTRTATAIAISQNLFPQSGTAGAVVLARSDGFADALAGTPLAAAKHAPLLLTPAGAPLDPGVASEISRVLAPGGTVLILGGESGLSPAVDAQLSSNFKVVRIAGADRYATAVAIADTGLGNPAVQILATGADFPDALSGGAAAASAGGAVLLTNGASLPPATASYLAIHPGTRWAFGGPAAAAGSGLGATPIVGADRYDTGVRAAEAFFPNAATVGFASGQSFPDALGGGVHAAGHHAPLLLVAPDQVPGSVQTYLGSTRSGSSSRSAFVYGGANAVSQGTASALLAAL